MPTGKGFTPIIGLAVVVALAMAAVFGAMSLTNPAFAAVGAPADAELAERTFSPQQSLGTVEVYEGATLDDIDLRPHLTEAQIDGVTSIGVSGHDTAIATVIGIVNRSAVAVRVTGVADSNTATDTTSALVTVNIGEGATDPDVLFVVSISVLEATGAMVVENSVIPLQLVEASSDGATTASPALDDARPKVVDVTSFFMDGMGNGGPNLDGGIVNYTATSNPGSILGTIDDSATGMLSLKADDSAAVGQSTEVTVTAQDDHDALTDPTHTFTVILVAAGALGPGGPGSTGVGIGTFTPDSSDPGDGSLYTFVFPIDREFNGGLYSLTLKLEQFDLPSSISTSSIALEVQDAGEDVAAATGVTTPDDNLELERTGTNADEKYTFNPATVTVDGKEIILTIPDVRPEADVTKKSFSAKSEFRVLIYQSAGVSNPTEANTYGGAEPNDDREIFATFGDSGVAKVFFSSMMVPRIVEIDPEDGGLGETVTVTGKGFKDGTTLTVFLDQNRNGNLELDEDELCVALKIGKDDIGSCEFEVTHPTFEGGPADDQMNYINAVDGRNGYVNKKDGDYFDLPKFELGASISATPKGGSPGEIILIQLLDFPKNRAVTDVLIANRALDRDSYSATTDSTGAVNFPITIPNWVKAGTQQLKVEAGGEDGSQNIDLLGPQINVTPKSVLANQRVSLVGTGFSPGAVIANDTDSLEGSDKPVVTIGGKEIVGTRINDSDPVRVDNGGNWSASVDLPLAEATTAEGERAIRITDSRGRSGVALVNIPAREVTVTPENGRVGTIAVIRGSGFPSKNDEGSSFNVQIVYDASNGNTTTVSATPDASGRFETQLRIPTTAAIPSNNSIKVSFKDEALVDVVTTVAHDVPEGIITLSETSGGPGSFVTVNGEGFKSFVPISLVKIGTLDITPAPKPATDGNGMLSFSVTIPGLDVGIQTIEVHVGRTTSSTGFTVTESGVNPGDIKEVAVGLEPLGDNFVSVWHFNNDTKMWSFYTPALEEGNSLTHLITGETYLIRVKSTVEVILNNDTRNLTCVGDNCWNQLVW